MLLLSHLPLAVGAVREVLLPLRFFLLPPPSLAPCHPVTAAPPLLLHPSPSHCRLGRAHGEVARQRLRAAGPVLDHEHRRRGVAVADREAACEERHPRGQVAVDEAEALLLALADAQRPVDLEAVDEELVLVVAAAAHREGVGQLIRRGHTQLCLDAADGVGHRERHVADRPRVDAADAYVLGDRLALDRHVAQVADGGGQPGIERGRGAAPNHEPMSTRLNSS